MKKFIYYTFLLFSILVITSCQKVIDLKLDNATGLLVIEGNITNVTGPQTVKLSTNVPFSDNNTYPPVTGAQVSVSDQAGYHYTFTEGPDGTYTFNPLVGISGNTYTLTIVNKGKSYTASSTMPVAAVMDSVTAKNQEFDNSSNTKRQITVHYKDMAGVANQYRFVMYVNDVQVKRTFANNDDFNDGRYVHLNLRQDDIDIHPGDKVTVEMQCIDKTVYRYWFTLQQQDGGPGGGVTPSNPPNNISPSAFGCFSAHTVQSVTFVVK